MGYDNIEQGSGKRTKVPNKESDIGPRIKAVCDHLGSRKYASKIGGVSEDMIYKYISGDTIPRFDVLARLCDAAKVSMEWVATGVGSMQRAPSEEGVLNAIFDKISARSDETNIQPPFTPEHRQTDPVLSATFTQLIEITEDPDISVEQKGRAKATLELLFGHKVSKDSREERAARITERLRAGSAAYERVLAAVDWDPPSRIGMAVRDALALAGLTEEGAVHILEAIKTYGAKQSRTNRQSGPEGSNSIPN